MNGLGSELRTLLETWREGMGSIVTELPALLKTHFEADQAVVYGLEPASGRSVDLNFVHTSGIPHASTDVRHHMKNQLGAARWALYSPLHPERHQRNRAHRLPSYAKVSQGGPDLAHKLGVSVEVMRALNPSHPGWVTHARMGLLDQRVLRLLICDGGRLLAWIGVFRDTQFSQEAALEMQSLAPVLLRRLKLEEQLATAPIAATALVAALNHIGGRAVLVDARGAPVAVNSRAKDWLDTDYGAASAELAGALSPGARDSRFDATPVLVPGYPPHHLLVDRITSPGGSAASDRAAARWRLTRREAQVLAHLVQGESNPAIACSVGCTIRTVEFHVTNLLRKAGCASRAELSAAVWTLP